jgi:hypothetical protein
MRTKIFFHPREVTFIFILIFWFMALNSTKSQIPTNTPLAKTATPLANHIIQYDDYPNNLHYIGIGGVFQGLIMPSAILHINEPLTNPSNFPLFQVEGTNPGFDGLIKNWFTVNSNTYGLYETSTLGPMGSQVLNYFQDPIEFGLTTSNMTLNATNAYETRFISSSLIHQFKFVLGPATPDYTNTPLTINPNGIIVHPTAVMDGFQLTASPSLGYVLQSDANGNGSWADPTKVLDYWQLLNNNIYLNSKYSNVGIGTNVPRQSLHVVDGNILISASSSGGTGTGGMKAPSSKNGSILFGDAIYDSNILGEWGIEYATNSTDYNSNGLNFWKPYSSGSGGGDNYLYLRNDGNVGIGTANPGDKLQVSDGYNKVVFGSGIGVVNPNYYTLGNSYIGLNASHSSKGWLCSSNGIYNGGSLIYNDTWGDIYFTAIGNTGSQDQSLSATDIYNKTKMIIFNDGSFEMGDNLYGSPASGTLEVRRTFTGVNNCMITSHSVSSDGTTFGSSYLWAINDNDGISLMIDPTGIGHITGWKNQSSIMSFLPASGAGSEKVGIGNVDLLSYQNSNTASTLFVEGGITTESVNVKLKSGGWPDFVFNKKNKVRSISELDQYIKTNKHLPDFPTSTEVNKDGIEVGKMDEILLQKVEELSLYIIELKKEITDLQNKKGN